MHAVRSTTCNDKFREDCTQKQMMEGLLWSASPQGIVSRCQATMTLLTAPRITRHHHVRIECRKRHHRTSRWHAHTLGLATLQEAKLGCHSSSIYHNIATTWPTACIQDPSVLPKSDETMSRRIGALDGRHCQQVQTHKNSHAMFHVHQLTNGAALTKVRVQP